MEFINAFLLGGTLCVIFQAVMMVTKIDPPKLLIAGCAIGALLTVFGITPVLMQWGGAGLAIMIIDAGEAFVGATMAAWAGDFSVALLVAGILVAVSTLGIIAGYGWSALNLKKGH